MSRIRKTDAIMAQSGLLPISTAARACGVVDSTIHRWISANRMKGHRIGHWWYVSVNDLTKHYTAEPIRERLNKALADLLMEHST